MKPIGVKESKCHPSSLSVGLSKKIEADVVDQLLPLQKVQFSSVQGTEHCCDFPPVVSRISGSIWMTSSTKPCGCDVPSLEGWDPCGSIELLRTSCLDPSVKHQSLIVFKEKHENSSWFPCFEVNIYIYISSSKHHFCLFSQTFPFLSIFFLGVEINILYTSPCVVSVSRGFQTMPVAPKGRGAGPIFRELPWQDGSMSCLLFLGCFGM